MHRALSLVLAPAICLAQAPVGPRAVLEPKTFSFGQILEGTVAVHTFKVTNTGDALLKISGLRAACGCTTTVIGKMNLEPGEATDIELTFHAGGFFGPLTKSVTILTNEHRLKPLVLVFDADVLRRTSLSDPDVYFRDLGRGDHPKKSVKVVPGSPKPIEITNLDLSEAPWLGVATREEDGALYVDLDLLAKNLPPGKREGTDTVTLHVTDPQTPTLDLKVHWQKRAPVRMTPEKVAWSGAAGQALKASLSLEGVDRKPFRILSTRTSNPLLSVRELGGRKSAHKTLEVVLSGAAKPGEYDEKVFLTLDTPEHPEVVVRVVASLH